MCADIFMGYSYFFGKILHKALKIAMTLLLSKTVPEIKGDKN